MDNKDHKIFTTFIVFILMVTGVVIAGQFNQISHDALNTALLLVNSLLLLIIMGIVFHMRDQSGRRR
jgi:hypothetical protein